MNVAKQNQMKTLLVILAMAAFQESKAFATNPLALPNLGAGDPKLLVWMHPKDFSDFTILAYTGTKSLPEYNLSSDNCEKDSLRLLYPLDDGPLIALKLQHCYPFGNGQGFLRTTNISTKNIPAKSGTGMKFDVTVEPSDIVLFEEQNGGLVTKILDDETVRQEFDLKPGCRFLGKLDNFLFYWNQRDEDTIVGRDTTTDKVYSWKVPGVYVVEGVLRGIKYDYGIVVYRKISGFLSNAMGEKAVIEVSVKDAVVEPKRQP